MTLEQIAQDIADESECCVIESSCPIVVFAGLTWYDTTAHPERDPAPLKRALGYLKMRGLLIVALERTNLVRIDRASELGLATLNYFDR
jgi:hypothetical protein